MKRMALTNILLKQITRFNSTKCASKFHPLNDTYKTLRHIHFPGSTLFEDAQTIQDSFVNANLDFKNMASKIRKQKKEIAASGHSLSEYENDLLNKILDMRPVPTLLTFEFNNVYTGGKRIRKSKEIDLLKRQFKNMGCQYHQLDRGGEITWHGKGQLVAYLIIDLKEFKNLTVRCYIDSVLLKALQNTLSSKFGISTYLNENPGIWDGNSDMKLASVGCHVQRAITSFGVALNVNPDLTYLNSFTMCGLPGKRATSISEIKPGTKTTVKEVGAEYARSIARCLNIPKIEHVDGKDIKVDLEN